MDTPKELRFIAEEMALCGEERRSLANGTVYVALLRFAADEIERLRTDSDLVREMHGNVAEENKQLRAEIIKLWAYIDQIGG